MYEKTPERHTQRVIRRATLNPTVVLLPSVELFRLTSDELTMFALDLETTWKELGLGDTETPDIAL